MDDTEGAVAAQDAGETRAAKPLRRQSITLLVALGLTALAFGKAPLAYISAPEGSRLNFDFLSCLGILGGAYAVLVFAFHFRAILRPPGALKVLGLIGGIGLIVHTWLALFFPLSYGAARPVGAGAYSIMGQYGAEQWQIDGRTCRVTGSYYLMLPQGIQYTIEYPWLFRPGDPPMIDEQALQIAFPLMKHAYQQGLHNRGTVTKVGHGRVAPSRIGVVLYAKQGGRTRGYRVALTLKEIKRRIDQAAATTQSVSLSGAVGARAHM